MKEELSSLDLRILAGEFERELKNARIDKIYQIDERKLKIKLYIRGKGSRDLIIAPNYICLTNYRIPAPEMPSSFAMQLRKNISGAFIRHVEQHKFDRILEFRLEKKDKRMTLVVELFSRGNVILCDSDRKIIGLLEWQKWRDRKLGVGHRYEYPPPVVDTPNLKFEEFKDIMENSEKTVVSVLARDLSLGGTYAEEICIRSEIEKDRTSHKLFDEEILKLYESLQTLINQIVDNKKPQIILGRDKGQIDLVLQEINMYGRYNKKEFNTLNDAADEYFNRAGILETKKTEFSNFGKKLKKLREILKTQEKRVDELEDEYRRYRRIGDLIYQNMNTIDSILSEIRKEHKKGADWGEIEKKFAGREIGAVRIEEIKRDGSIIINVNENDWDYCGHT